MKKTHWHKRPLVAVTFHLFLFFLNGSGCRSVPESSVNSASSDSDKMSIPISDEVEDYVTVTDESATDNTITSEVVTDEVATGWVATGENHIDENSISPSCPIEEDDYACISNSDCLSRSGSIHFDYVCSTPVACCEVPKLDRVVQDTAFDTSIWYWETDDGAYISYIEDTDGFYDANLPYDYSTCADFNVDIKPAAPRIMILQDISSNMNEGEPSKWEQAQSALMAFIGTIGFSQRWHVGFDVFPNSKDCVTDIPVVIDSAPQNGDNIFDLMSMVELSEEVPLFSAMGNFLEPDYAPAFADSETPHYLIIISGAPDTCGDKSEHTAEQQIGASAEELGDQAMRMQDKRHIITIPIGFGEEAPMEQLDMIARNGGSDYDEAIYASDRNELVAALEDIATYTIPCTYEIILERISQSNDTTFVWEEIDFYLNGDPTHRDPGCADGSGWRWRDPDSEDATRSIVLCDDLCEIVKHSERIDIAAEINCPISILPI